VPPRCHYRQALDNAATVAPIDYSRFLRAPFQFSKRAASEAAEFSRSGIKYLGVIGAARLECAESAAEAGELIWRQVGNSFGDFFDFPVAQYSTGWVERRKEIGRFRLLRVGLSSFRCRSHRGNGRS
jgi:hypothetical protein